MQVFCFHRVRFKIIFSKSNIFLDFLNIYVYIVYIMNNSSDIRLINIFVNWCIANDMNQSEIAKKVGRTRGWASLLVNGKISHLQFTTRNRIKHVLGIQ